MQPVKNNGKEALDAAYAKGKLAFETVELNSKGFYNNPGNPYAKGSLTYKMFNLGYDHAYLENIKCASN